MSRVRTRTTSADETIPGKAIHIPSDTALRSLKQTTQLTGTSTFGTEAALQEILTEPRVMPSPPVTTIDRSAVPQRRLQTGTHLPNEGIARCTPYTLVTPREGKHLATPHLGKDVLYIEPLI